MHMTLDDLSSNPSPPRFLVIGQLNRPHGIRGEIRMQVMTNYPERLQGIGEIAISPHKNPDEGSLTWYTLERVRFHKDQAILKLSGIDDRDAADFVKQQYAFIALEQAVPLDDGEYYFFQLIGLSMILENGETIGHVVDILETGANEVYVVQSPQYGELLIPAIESVIQSIDLEQRRIIITPISGLLPDQS